jgi:acetolactate synthase-1/2/3 large subunit
LHAHGVRHAFGMPGGEVVTLLDGLERAGIRFCLARHETQAALMAEGASVVGGAPGVLVTTIGPGLTNAVNGIADASQEKVPLIVLSGVVDRTIRDRFTHQVIDHKALLAAVVKASFEVEPGTVAETLSQALSLALTPPMGPVHLDLSPSVAAASAPTTESVIQRVARGGPVAAPDHAVQQIAQRLSSAERPVILAGYEAAAGGAGHALVELAEKAGAPVITTYKAKGVMPETHALSLGAAGLSPGADTILLDLVQCSDLLLLVGYDPIEMRQPWLDPAPAHRIVEIADTAYRHGMHQAGMNVLADLPATLGALHARIDRKNSTWTGGEIHQAREALRDRVARSGWGPHEIIRCLNLVHRPGDIVTVDSGAHRILLSQMWQAHEPLTLLQSAGFCTMAAALPLAIGAAVTEPGRRITAVMGDGGLEMGIGELATARDLGVKLTVVLFQDESLALIALKQRASGLKRCGVGVGQTDFAAVAQGFGGHGVTVDTTDDFRSALAAAHERDGLSLIACRFPEEAYENAL